MPKRPPKEWFYYVVGELEKRPEVTDPKALAGWLWYHWAKPETKRAILRGEGKLDPSLKVRKSLVKTPKVLRYADFEGRDSMIRVLLRAGDSAFPEFAIYASAFRPPFDKKRMGEVLKLAGFEEEAKGKWVLRTNKFSMFVYV